jgi:CheY-like chemotaxis protein
VFDLFVQAGQPLARSQGGLGLGLTIVKSLVTMHGGTVAADSMGPGKGSRFTVRLPVLDLQPELPVQRECPSLAPQPKQERVLIVDDNLDAADLLSEAVRLLGYRTATANDGLQALEVASEFKPHAALLDIGLPVMDGYELAEQLRSKFGQAVRMIAITGYGQETDKARSHRAGFEEHLTKPVDVGKLAQLLEEKTRLPSSGTADKPSARE